MRNTFATKKHFSLASLFRSRSLSLSLPLLLLLPSLLTQSDSDLLPVPQSFFFHLPEIRTGFEHITLGLPSPYPTYYASELIVGS